MALAILISSDEVRLSMDLEIAKKMSRTLKEKLEYSLVGYEHDKEMNGQANLPSIRGEIVKLVIDWCNRHKDDPEPLEMDEDDPDNSPFKFIYRTDNINGWDAWDQQFVSKNQAHLPELELAARYLKIYDLWVAVRIKQGKGYFIWMRDIHEVVQEREEQEQLAALGVVDDDETDSEEEFESDSDTDG